MSGHHSVAGARHPLTRWRCVSAGIYYFFEYGDERATFGSFEDAVAVFVFGAMEADRSCPAHHPGAGPRCRRPRGREQAAGCAAPSRCRGGRDADTGARPAGAHRLGETRPATAGSRCSRGVAPARTRAARSGATRTDAPRVPDRRTGRTMGTADRYPESETGLTTVIAHLPHHPPPFPSSPALTTPVTRMPHPHPIFISYLR